MSTYCQYTDKTEEEKATFGKADCSKIGNGVVRKDWGMMIYFVVENPKMDIHRKKCYACHHQLSLLMVCHLHV